VDGDDRSAPEGVVDEVDAVAEDAASMEDEEVEAVEVEAVEVVGVLGKSLLFCRVVEGSE
jgi:hypothetical protein